MQTADRHLLCEHFLGWQCRIRQHAVRHGGGRPSSGMRPTVALPGSDTGAEVTVLINKSESYDHTARFRHIVRKTHDPAERLEEAMKELSAAYYQRPREFADVMTALFGLDSGLATQLTEAGECTLHFDQFSQRYVIPCRVDSLAEADEAYQATYWHNAMFNPTLPGVVRILSLAPDWARASADPMVG